MESKLRNEKVVDLKKILTGAKITIPAKANKAELIQTILKSKDALAYYENMKAEGSGEASAVGTPVPAAVTPVVNQTDAGDTTTAPKDDLLAPPEEFDWTTGQTTASSEPATSKTAQAKPASQTKSTYSTGKRVEPAGVTSSNESNPSTAPTAPLDPEEEAKKRRAERFGITYIPPKPKEAAKPKPAAIGNKKDASIAPKAPAANGKISGAPPSAEDVERLRTRADRFGIATKSKATPADAALGQKRSAPVDPEEQERMRKRAERFGLPVPKPQAAPIVTEEEERKQQRAERFAAAGAK